MRAVFLFLCTLTTTATAAPPSLTYLYPAGGRVGQTVEVNLGGAFPTWPVDVWCSDSKIKAIASKEKAKLILEIPQDVVVRPVQIRVFTNEGASAPRSFILGRLAETTEIEPNDEPAKSQLINGNQVINGRLNKTGDADLFRVKLQKGETLIASLTANETILSPVDAAMQLISPDGFVLMHDHDTNGLDPRIVWTATKDTEVIVRIFGFPSQPDSSIQLSGNDTYIYRLLLTTGPVIDHVQPVVLPETGEHTVQAKGWNLPPTLTTLPTQSFGRQSLVKSPLLPTDLELTRVPIAVSTDLSKAIVPPIMLSAVFTKPDEMLKVKVIGKKSQQLRIIAYARRLNTLATPVIRVRKMSGELVSNDGPSNINVDAEGKYTPPEDGPFIVELIDQYAAFGMRTAFAVQIRPITPDFTATLPSDRIGIKPGSTVDVSVSINRLDGFSDSLNVLSTNLPKGVTVAVLPPAGKMDPKTIGLRITATNDAASGSCQLSFQASGKKDLSRVAKATIPELTPATTEHLWIAVTTDPIPPMKKSKK